MTIRASVTTPGGFQLCVSTNDIFTPTTATGMPGGNAGPGSINLGTTNTMGGLVTVATANQISFAPERIIVEVVHSNAATISAGALLDLLYVTAGGPVTVASSLLFGGAVGAMVYELNLANAPAGVTWVVQGQSNSGTRTVARVNVIFYGEPIGHSERDVGAAGQFIQALGVNRANSAGTVVTAGTANAFGAWVTLGSLSFDCREVVFGLQVLNTSVVLGQGYQYQFGWFDGVTHNPMPAPVLAALATLNETIANPRSGGYPARIALPAGTHIVARGRCNLTSGINSDDALEVAAYAVI